MKYRVGEKVIIRKDLETHKKYSEVDVAYSMMEFRGETVTISKVWPKYYQIEEDRGNWVWGEDMFISTGIALIGTPKELSDIISIRSVKPKLYFS